MVSKDQKNKLWDKAKKIRGKNPDLYRQDPYGDMMYKSSYGKNSKMGWQIDHIKPESKGGSDATVNLQALKTKTTLKKGNSSIKRSRHSKRNK